MADPIELWTGFDNRKLAAERARCDWKGNVIEAPNDVTVEIKAGNNATADGSFTTNQSSGSTITIGAASSNHDGVMTSTDKSKLDGIASDATKVEASGTNGNIKINDQETAVYGHPKYGPTGGATVGETADKSPAFGGTFKVLGAQVDESGHTTAIAEHTVTIPSATAVASTGGSGGSDGLMAAADKEKLNGIESGAQANVKPDWNAAAGSDAEILNKPSIPTVNDGTLTITVAGVATTFSANQSSNASVSIPNAASASGQDPATGGLMTAGDKEDLDFATSVIPASGTHAASTNNPLVTTSAMEAALADFGGFKVVNGTGADNHPDLPSGETPSTKIIYLVKDTSAPGDDKYKEWICTNVSTPTWELIGDTTMSMAGYAKIPNSKTSGNLVEFTANDELADSGTTVSALENTIESISVNGSAQTITNKNVDITVPVAGTATPSGDGTAAVGTSSAFAREDHVHPSDTSKVDKVTGATDGNFASFDANGGIQDSGSKASDFKTKQTAVSDPSASGNAISFIDSISQNANGEITPTKKTVPTVVASQSGAGGNDGLMTAQQAETLAIMNTWTYATFTSSGMSGSEQVDTLPRQQQP